MRGEQPTIHIEITVPQIRIAESGQHEPAVWEQVRWEPAGSSQAGNEPEIQREVSTRQARTRRFSLHRLKGIPVQGKNFLLQILRQQRSSQARETGEISERIEFSLGYTQGNVEGERPHIEAGRPHIEIKLNEEGLPSDYSIDGAES